MGLRRPQNNPDDPRLIVGDLLNWQPIYAKVISQTLLWIPYKTVKRPLSILSICKSVCWVHNTGSVTVRLLMVQHYSSLCLLEEPDGFHKHILLTNLFVTSLYTSKLQPSPGRISAPYLSGTIILICALTVINELSKKT